MTLDVIFDNFVKQSDEVEREKERKKEGGTLKMAQPVHLILMIILSSKQLCQLNSSKELG